VSVAERAAAAMWKDDRAAQGLGIRIEGTGEGYSRLSMTVREDMTNGHNIVHGGFIFALADTAFAYACNSSGQRTVASQCVIAYLAPAWLGERLVAEARETYRIARQGITDVTVTKEDGTVVAHFRGHSRTIKGSLFDSEERQADAENA